MITLLWVLAVVCASRGIEVEEAVKSCLLRILENYFPNNSVLLIENMTPRQESSQRRLLPEVESRQNLIRYLMKKKKWTFQVYDSNKYSGLPSLLKWRRMDICVFFLPEWTTMTEDVFEEEMNALRTNPIWDSSGRNIIVVPTRGLRSENEILSQKVIKKLWMGSKAIDNLVLIAHQDGRVHLYTWLPYRQPDCSQVKEIIHLDSFTKKKGFRWQRDLFPNKIKEDLDGCELVAASGPCIPYVITDEDTEEIVGGLEILIADFISEKLNFKMKTVQPENMWVTTVNGSTEGAFKLLVEQKIDFAFSCLMLNQERYQLAMALPPYYSDSLTWFVPSPVPKTHAYDIYFTFPYQFWLVMILVIASAIVPTILLTIYESQKPKPSSRFLLTSIFNLIGMSLYIPVEFVARKAILRCFLFTFFVYSMHITIAFQASLFRRYREPHFDRVFTSLKQAVDANLFVYLRPYSEDLYNQSDHDTWTKIFQPHRHDYLNDFGEVFSQIAYDKNAIALFIKSTGIYMISMYFTDDYGEPEILWLPERFSSYPVAMFMSPGNPLYILFRHEVYRIIASGLIRHWIKDLVTVGKLRAVKMSGRYGNRPLSLEHLQGAFFLLSLLLGISVLVFVFEMVNFRIFDQPKIDMKHRRRNMRVKRLQDPVKVGRFGLYRPKDKSHTRSILSTLWDLVLSQRAQHHED